jgi:hypothetical protein
VTSTVPPPPCARQGAQDGRVRPHEAAFVEAAEGGRGYGGDDEQSPRTSWPQLRSRSGRQQP